MFDIMSKKKYFLACSVVVIIAGIIGFIINGLQLDIQFEGGTIIQVAMPDDNFDAGKIENDLSAALNKKVTAQKLQTYNSQDTNAKVDMLMLKVSKENTLNEEEFNNVVEILRNDFGVKPDAQMDVQNVQPFIGKEMLRKGLQAAFLASILIILYLWLRFSAMSGLSAAVFAVVCLAHDVLIMFSVYTIFRIPINESFVAAILTILGYSINDTIIIYDRIRENSGLLRKIHVNELVNRSILQTLTRSINTVLTTLISIITVYIFATVNNIQSLKEFTLPLIVGIVSGTYSSIFIAGPLWATWTQFKSKKKVSSKTVRT